MDKDHKDADGNPDKVQAILSTSPVAKVGAQTMYEFTIQKKELGDFNTYSLQNVEGAFSQF